MKVAVVGVTGYSGIELVRYLLNHPQVELLSVHSQSMNKKSLTTVFPHLQGQTELQIETLDAEKIMATCELVFFATPSGISKELALPFITANFPVIDLSGDFRLKEEGAYQRWYAAEAAPQALVEKFDYGLAEFRQQPTASLIANPGCYATAAELSLAPLLKAGLITPDSIIIDGKSGLSGAGKKLSTASHFAESHETVSSYKLNQHQHIPEIIQQLQVWEPQVSAIQFTTTLIPVTRGIFMTTYAKASKELTTEQLVALFEATYESAKFVRIQAVGKFPALKQVIGSNFCDIGIVYNPATQLITICTVIDNLGKGAAGQAVQNMNIFAGYPEEMGLLTLPLYP